MWHQDPKKTSSKFHIHLPNISAFMRQTFKAFRNYYNRSDENAITVISRYVFV